MSRHPRRHAQSRSEPVLDEAMIGLDLRSIGMSPNEIGPQWQKLCEEHAAARDAYFRAFAAVNQKFSDREGNV